MTSGNLDLDLGIEGICMLISTVIPTIGRDSLSRAVQSALQQDLNGEEHEIIIMNDSGVPLPTMDWMLSSQVTVLNTNRSGVCFACNAGVTIAQGKYIKILHDDDYLLPGGLRALLYIAEATNSSVIIGGLELVDNEGCLIETQTPLFNDNSFALFVVGESAHMSQSLLRRDDFLAVAGFDPLVKSAEDRDLMCRLSFHGNFASTEKIVACVRFARSPGSAFNTSQVTAARQIREKALNMTGALSKALDSAGQNAYLRGRISRNYMFSGVLNLLKGNLFIALSRTVFASRAAVPYLMTTAFWRGAMYRLQFNSQGRRATS
jgi:glycosyltransferase involved in cell wall biosynthesis